MLQDIYFCRHSAQQLAAAIEQCAEPETVLEWLINYIAF